MTAGKEKDDRYRVHVIESGPGQSGTKTIRNQIHVTDARQSSDTGDSFHHMFLYKTLQIFPNLYLLKVFDIKVHVKELPFVQLISISTQSLF